MSVILLSIMAGILAVLLACLCAVIYLLAKARLGYDDEAGYHAGVPYEGDRP